MTGEGAGSDSGWSRRLRRAHCSQAALSLRLERGSGASPLPAPLFLCRGGFSLDGRCCGWGTGSAFQAPSIHQAPPADLSCPPSPTPGAGAPAIDCGGKGLLFELSCFTLRFLSRFLAVVNYFCLYVLQAVRKHVNFKVDS